MAGMDFMVVDMSISTINSASTQAPLLRLLQLVSPSLPIGAFAYSQGLEQAVENAWVNDESSTREWLQGVVTHSFANLEIPLLSRCYRAWQLDDVEAVSYWSDTLLASRETSELYEEERLLGLNLARLLNDLGIAEAEEWRETRTGSLLAMFALASVKWSIPLPMAAQAYAWIWCEGQVAAAIKLVPLGQTAGQRLYMDLSEDLNRAVEAGLALTDETHIGRSALGVAMASSWHETQYSRLFRS